MSNTRTRYTAALLGALCATLAAPAAARAADEFGGGAVAAGEVQPGARPANVHEGVFGQVRAGPAIPLSGPLADMGAVGGALQGVSGWQLPMGLTVAGMLGGRYHNPTGFTHNAVFLNLSLGLLGRFTFLPQYAFHPFVEAQVDLHLVALGQARENTSRSSSSRSADSSYTVGAGAGGGVELDLSPNWSIELGVRLDAILTTGLWRDAGSSTAPTLDVLSGGGSQPAADVLVTPYLGISFYR